MSTPTKINIGAGKTRIPGFVNVDIAPHADVSIDLNSEPLPFADDSIDVVFSYHALEHIPNYLFALGEIHRVLKHGGWFLLGVPYVTSTEYHLVNPYHLHNFNEFSFDFFDPARLKGSAVEGNPILFEKIYHDFYYNRGFQRWPRGMRRWFRRHLFNVVKKIDFGLVAIKANQPLQQRPEAQQQRDMLKQCLRSRIRYGSAASKAAE